MRKPPHPREPDLLFPPDHAHLLKREMAGFDCGPLLKTASDIGSCRPGQPPQPSQLAKFALAYDLCASLGPCHWSKSIHLRRGRCQSVAICDNVAAIPSM